MRNRNTLDYYNKNALEFSKKTINADMSEAYNHFIKYLPKGANILDFGCGSGRDLKYFLNKGFRAEGIDGSETLAKLASEFTGKEITVVTFENYTASKYYDGIWACASLVHFPVKEIKVYLKKLNDSLKDNGILYFSLKDGNFEGVKNQRYFKYFSQNELNELIQTLEHYILLDYWISEDVRDRNKPQWHNVILKKLRSSR